MSVAKIFTVLGLAIAASAAWKLKDSSAVQALFENKAQPVRAIEFDNGSSRQPDAAQAARAKKTSPSGIAGLHKCVRGKTVVYTDEPCDHPAQERAVSGGVVTVVAATGGQKKEAAAAPSGIPTARDMLVGNQPPGPSMTDRAIEQSTR